MLIFRSTAITLWFLIVSLIGAVSAQEYPITRIATNLQNPRGVAILPGGHILLAEAGTGFVSDDPQEQTGKLSLLVDVDGDGDYDDDGERTTILDHLPGYNILYQFNPGRDEIVGVGDLLIAEHKILLTLDDNFEKISIVELNSDLQLIGDFHISQSSLNSLAFDPDMEVVYVAESSYNRIGAIPLNGDGQAESVATLDELEHGQQAVPSGIAFDPTTGDLLVALFSGQLWDYYGSILSFMPGDAKIVRIDPRTGTVEDEITGLTAAVDVEVDEVGNIYVVELTTEWSMPTMSTNFDVYAPDAAPDAGGYARYSGRVTLYPAGGTEPVILAEDLDAPTNLTYADNKLYVSTGQGTPGRSVWVNGESKKITGELYVIQL